ncbi:MULTISPECIES: HesA/MoeB/ThiF family protein [Snodgrassella]|uniref:HesA/MoeB/ThiF family protein n=1 Tax=Snodgrassella TaxID=1193515 RepID=UPI0008157997|nr:MULTISPECIES: ThiF family adenylyltransferase [Snodgrassella]SCC21363.1 Molybdopterin or thiamine biosynthesis adenylyltransferase [Snodgrassella sp. R-53583]
MITDEQLLRYSRHILLDKLDIAGQEAILAARALVIGAGGLAHPALTYLVSSGVGHITVVDNDSIEISNLQRQYWFSDQNIGEAKARVLCRQLQAHHPHAQLQPVVARADTSLLQQQVQHVDIVLDCTDNFASRRLINQVCFNARKPLVSASALVFAGQLAVYDFRDGHGPCYQCLFEKEMNDEGSSCAKNGVFAPLLGIMGAAQASEALQVIAGIHPSGCWLHCFDAHHFQWQRLQLAANPDCPVCGQTALSTKPCG